jgi:hypothetical protein
LNTSFEIVGRDGPDTVHDPSLPGFAGGSAAESWSVFQNTVGTTTTTSLLPTTLSQRALALTALTVEDAGTNMIHVVTGAELNGILQATGPSNSGVENGVASAWVYVNDGRVGMGSGNSGQTVIDVMTTTTGAWELLKAPNGVAQFNEIVFFAVGGAADFFVELADMRELQELSTDFPRIEYSNDLDEQAVAGGDAHGGLDPGQLLYTVPIDGTADNQPRDILDFFPGIENGSEPDAQVDALAQGGDAFFDEVVSDQEQLLISLEGDPGPGVEVGVYVEHNTGSSGIEYTHRDLHALDTSGQLEDVDALELWGETGVSTQPNDADFYSLHGDATGTSIFSYVTGSPVPYITQNQVFAALIPLGFTGTSSDVDVDALMVQDVREQGVWGEADAVLFSIRAANGWDGGEIILWRFGAAAAFLQHGGHVWNTAFDVANAFDTAVEEVDALEARPVPEPGSVLGLLAGGILLVLLCRRRSRPSTRGIESMVGSESDSAREATTS